MKSLTLKISLLLSILLPGIQALGQGLVKGIIYDEKQQPLSYSTVTIKDSVNKVTLNRITDNDGVFLFDNVKYSTYKIYVSSIGYQSYSKTIIISTSDKQADLGKITLKTDTKMLAAVTVTGRKNLLSVQNGKITLNVANSVLGTGSTASEVLKAAPSVRVDEKSITMKGKSNVMILLDGKEVPKSTMAALLNSMPSDQIDKIELLSNPPAKYEASASGGVINIITKKGQAAGLNGTVTGGLSQGKEFGENASGTLNYRDGRWSVLGSASYSNRNDFERGYNDRTFTPNSTYNQILNSDFDLGAQKRAATYKLAVDYLASKNNTLTFAVNGLYNRLTNKGTSFTEVVDGVSDQNISALSQMYNRIFFQNYDLTDQWNIDTLGSSWSNSLLFSRYEDKSTQFFNQNFAYPDGTSQNGAFRNGTPSVFNLYTYKSDFEKYLPNHNVLDAGIKVTDINSKSEPYLDSVINNQFVRQEDATLNKIDYNELILAAYLSDTKTFNKLTVTPGLRVENTSYNIKDISKRNYFNLFPSLNLSYKVSANFTTSASYSRKIDRPNYGDLIPYKQYMDNYTVREGNPLLQPQYSNVIELNEAYKDYIFSATYTYATDQIVPLFTYDNQQLLYILQPRNLKSAQMLNLSFNTPIKLVKWLNTQLGIDGNYQDLNIDNISGISNISTTKWTYGFNVYNKLTLTKTMSADVLFVYQAPSRLGLIDINAYNTLNIAIQKSILKKKGTIKLGASDLFYKTAPIITTNYYPFVTHSIDRSDSRRATLSFTYRFGKPAKKANSNPDYRDETTKRLNL
jgi:outer membrane receptor protein involved in Fe transport